MLPAQGLLTLFETKNGKKDNNIKEVVVAEEGLEPPTLRI
jgi:hypothetical protein